MIHPETNYFPCCEPVKTKMLWAYKIQWWYRHRGDIPISKWENRKEKRINNISPKLNGAYKVYAKAWCLNFWTHWSLVSPWWVFRMQLNQESSPVSTAQLGIALVGAFSGGSTSFVILCLVPEDLWGIFWNMEVATPSWLVHSAGWQGQYLDDATQVYQLW